MTYGIYKDVRDSTWLCLLCAHIDRLPVDVLKIARTAGVRVIRNSSVWELLPGEHGKSYFDGNRWIVIYNDARSVVDSRLTVAHELGHIFLGHELRHASYTGVNEFQAKPKSEQQADVFATRLLCPACVLWGLGLQSPQQIALYCRVPLAVATDRAKRMELLYSRNQFLSSPAEKELYQQFCPYLQEVCPLPSPFLIPQEEHHAQLRKE